jgi:DNA-directed RNA polymerase subunit RPC12/RpoP
MAFQPVSQIPEATQPLTADPTTPPRVEMVKPEPALAPLPYTLDCSVEEFVLRRLRSAEDDGRWEEESRVQVIMNNVLFYRGQHWLYATKDCRVESMYETDDADDLIVHNWYAHLIEGKAKEWEASKPRIEITGRTRDYRLEASAKLAEALDSFTRKDSIKAHFRQSEAKFGMLCKVYYRRSVLEADETDETATRLKIPITQPKQFHIGAVYQCNDCQGEWDEPDHVDGYEPGEAIASPEMRCPNCGSMNQAETAPRFPFRLDVETGVNEQIVPVLRHETVNPLLVKIDHKAKRFQDSRYLVYDTLERRYELESEFEGADLTKVESYSNLPARLRAMLELERTSAGTDVMAFGESVQAECREDNLVRRRMFWMLPKMYGHYLVRADETCCGVEFKAGQRLGEVFPKGWLSVIVGEKTLVRFDDESKNKRWSGAAFQLDPTSFQGKGSEDWNSIQMAIDDKATLAASHFDRTGAPSQIVDTRIVDETEFDGSTGKRVPMKDTIPDGMGASDAVHVVESPQLGSDFREYAAAEPAILREIAGVSAPLVGLNDPNNKTARGREMAAAAASSMMIPSLALRAEEVEPETTYQNLEYWKQFGTDEDFEMFETEYGTEAIETFKQLNLRRDLVVVAAPGSWVPQTKDQELQNCEDFAAKYLLPTAEGQLLLPPAFIRHAASVLNIPKSAFEPEQDEKLAQSRLARLRGYAQKAFESGATRLSPPAYEAMLDQIVGQPEFLPNSLMENHDVHQEFYADQWKGMYDDKHVNPVLLDLIEKMYDSHETAKAAGQLKRNVLAMKAQMPIMAAGQRSMRRRAPSRTLPSRIT